MPVYEYECQACKYYTEVIQKITDAPLIKCPSCGKRRLKRLVSAPAFRLKGAGWYETDFKSDKEAKRNLLAGEKEEAKAESKPEAKEETAVAGKEVTGKEAAAGKETSAGKEAAGKEAKESPSEGSARRERPKGASRRTGSAAATGAAESITRSRRQTVAARPAASRRSARSTPRRKARRGRR